MILFNVCALAGDNINQSLLTFIFTQKAEELIDGNSASVTWKISIVSNDQAVVNVISWHSPIGCEGNYRIEKIKNKMFLIWIEDSHEESTCIEASPQFVIKSNSDGFFIKIRLFYPDDNMWLKLRKIFP